MLECNKNTFNNIMFKNNAKYINHLCTQKVQVLQVLYHLLA